MTSNGAATYVYDAENRLIATGGYSYIYDGDGERVEKCTEGTTPGSCASGATGTLYWRGLGSDPLSETDLSGNVQNTYIFFNGQRIARRDSAGAIHYYFSDHLGTHGVVENATATVCEQDIDYYPYGGVENDYCSGTGVPQNYKFTGKERDAESGLDNFGARYSTSSLGRFMTPDWAAKPVTVPYAKFGDPQTLNVYTYVENSPLNRIDADGHTDQSAGDQHQACGGGTSDCAAETAQQTQSAATQNMPAQIASYGTISEAISFGTSGPQVAITYDQDVPAMQPKTEDYVEKVAVSAGVDSINISATTNGEHAPNSNHYNGTAVDINKVNERVINAGKVPSVAADVRSVQNAANSPKNGVAHENYGPAGLFKDGKQITNPKLQSQHENHIHITIPRNTSDDN